MPELQREGRARKSFAQAVDPSDVAARRGEPRRELDHDRRKALGFGKRLQRLEVAPLDFSGERWGEIVWVDLAAAVEAERGGGELGRQTAWLDGMTGEYRVRFHDEPEVLGSAIDPTRDHGRGEQRIKSGVDLQRAKMFRI